MIFAVKQRIILLMINVDKKIFTMNNISLVYATVMGVSQLIIVPKGYEDKLSDEKLSGICPLDNFISPEPLMHVCLTGDGYSRDFSAGQTQRNSDTAFELKIISHDLVQGDNSKTLVTTFENGKGLTVRQYVTCFDGYTALQTYNEIENNGEEVTLEALPSFGFSRLSPFERYDDPSDIIIHKMRSAWSSEGKLFSLSAREYMFESSWSGLGIKYDRIGQVGSMPAKSWLPFIGIEDKKHKVCWGATLEAPDSWQIETVFRNNAISVGGGRGDFLNAHWRKKLKTGEKFTSKKAFICVLEGDVYNLCDSLVKIAHKDYKPVQSEIDLPVLYNDWCYNWGTPEQKKLEEILPKAIELGCKYFVVDDGWFEKGINGSILGDWTVRKEMFPNGLDDFGKKVRAMGAKFGVWYEFEGVSTDSEIFKNHPEYMLTLDGRIIKHDNRVFFDFRKQEVIDYLKEKVIGNLLANNIRYMKVDYNENIGLGADGAESYGEALRQHIEGVLKFFRLIKQEIPDLVLEVCSSGGMRHEPEFLSIADMVSFSDAHECPSGAPIAENLHNFIHPSKLQIWAVIRADYVNSDVAFTVAKAMLGRYCLSGNLTSCTPDVWETLKNSVEFYDKIKGVIANGTTTCIYTDEMTSFLNPTGKTYLIRESADKTQKVVYAFAIESPNASFELNVGDYEIKNSFNAPEDLTVKNGKITFTADNCKMWGSVLHLIKK